MKMPRRDARPPADKNPTQATMNKRALQAKDTGKKSKRRALRYQTRVMRAET